MDRLGYIACQPMPVARGTAPPRATQAAVLDAYLPSPAPAPAGPDLRVLYAGAAPGTSRQQDLDLVRNLTGYAFLADGRDPISARVFAEHLHDAARTTPLFITKDPDTELEVRTPADLAPLHFFFGESTSAPDDLAMALKALAGSQAELRTDSELDVFQAWQHLSRSPDAALDLDGGRRRGRLTVTSREDLFVVAHVWADGPTAPLARPDRAVALRRLSQDGAKVADLPQAYRGSGPIVLKNDEVTLLEAPPEALDRPNALIQAFKDREKAYDAVRAAVSHRNAEGLWDRVQPDVPGVAFDERVAAAVALGRVSRYGDDVGDLFDLLVLERPATVPFQDSAKALAACVERLGGEDGGRAWRRLNDLSDPERRDGYVALLELTKNVDVAERVFISLTETDLPDPLPARFATVQALHAALDEEDPERAVRALLDLRQPEESLDDAAQDLLRLAAAITHDRRDAVEAFRYVRSQDLAPAAIPRTQKQERFERMLTITGRLDHAREAYEAVAADARDFPLRADAMEKLLALAGKGKRLDALETFRALESRVPGAGFAAPETVRLLRLLDQTRSLPLAERIYASLQRSAGPAGYQTAEQAFQDMVAAAPDSDDRAERALSDYYFLLRRHGLDGLQEGAARFCTALRAAQDADEARRAVPDLERLPDPARYLRILEKGHSASVAREADRMLASAQDEAVLLRLMEATEDAPAALALTRAALSLPGTASLADDLQKAAAVLKSLDREGFAEPLRRDVLASARDRSDAIERLRDFTALASSTNRLDDALEAWNAVADSPRERRRALVPLLNEAKDTARALAFLTALESRGAQPIEAHADVLAGLASRNLSKAVEHYDHLREWAAETGDGSPQRLRRYAEVDFERVTAALTIPLGVEDFAARERLFWSLAESSKAPLEDYRHLTATLHPRTSLDELGRAWKTLLVACMDRRDRALAAFDRLHERLWDHPDESLEGLATWLAMNMTVNEDPQRVIARLEARPKDDAIAQTEDEVVIGKIRVPVRRKEDRVKAWAQALDEYIDWQLAPERRL